MSDEVEMGRTDQQGRAQQTALTSAITAGAGSVKAAQKSLAKVTKGFKKDAEVLVAQAEKALTNLKSLDQQGRYSEVAAVVQRFEEDNAKALAALQDELKKREGMTLSQVALLVENVREVGRTASHL
jgi:hypothetical protein